MTIGTTIPLGSTSPTPGLKPTGAFAEADHTFTATYVSQRQTGLPIETRGVVSDIDGGTLTVWTSTQSPHMVRTTIALMLGVPEPQVRVIHPVIGGGFGVKTHIYPEDIVVPWITRRLGRPARWIEDRMESLLASVHARDQRHDVEVAYDGRRHDPGRALHVDPSISAPARSSTRARRRCSPPTPASRAPTTSRRCRPAPSRW